MTPAHEKIFMDGWDLMQTAAYQNAAEKGHWEKSKSDDGTKIALMHSKLSRCLEALRDDKVAAQVAPSESLADLVLSVMSFSAKKQISLSSAIIARHAHNKKTPKKAGKKF